MTPQEKAQELLDKMVEEIDKPDLMFAKDYLPVAKQCALIAAREVISELNDMEETNTGKVTASYGQDYWQEVQEELNKL